MMTNHEKWFNIMMRMILSLFYATNKEGKRGELSD